MTGAEKQILKIVRELELADEEAISRKMGVSSEYVKEICECLMKSGHLSKMPEGYKITFKGKNVISSARIEYRNRSLL
ncbi:MAG: hypothetical protein ISS45_11850 [Candidatus Omnitrophica bacterium]|nr:hypothetical protein [Candidatus Omnitrophota bacterium]